jgi:hypothetical protein
MDTEGALPPWLPAPPSLVTSGRQSNASSISGTSIYRAGSKPTSLQDIYDSTSNSSSTTVRSGRSNVDSFDLGHRPSIARDRLRSNLRPSMARTPSSTTEQEQDPRGYNRGGGGGGYTGRSGLGGGDDYDPYSYQQGGGYDYGTGQRQGQYGGSGSSRQGAPRR